MATLSWEFDDDHIAHLLIEEFPLVNLPLVFTLKSLPENRFSFRLHFDFENNPFVPDRWSQFLDNMFIGLTDQLIFGVGDGGASISTTTDYVEFAVSKWTRGDVNLANFTVDRMEAWQVMSNLVDQMEIRMTQYQDARQHLALEREAAAATTDDS